MISLHKKPSLKAEVTKIIESAEDKEIISSGTVYFHDFSEAEQEFIVNPDFKFTPASLLKVPLSMSIYKLAEENPAILEKNVYFDIDEKYVHDEQIFKPAEKLQQGEQYRVEELIERMLKYSDNASMRLLLTILDDTKFIDVYDKLHVPFPADNTDDNYMSAKDYSAFLESLQAATYINKEYSDRILLFLSRSTFTEGLRAGVPEKFKVAHKFGERTLEGSPQTQIHDCGIVYLEKTSYLLCVMTKYEGNTNAPGVIAQVSKAVYQFMSR